MLEPVTRVEEVQPTPAEDAEEEAAVEQPRKRRLISARRSKTVHKVQESLGISEPLPEDASFRRYFRLPGSRPPALLMDAPPPPYYEPILPFSGNCDRKQHYECRLPSTAINMSV